MGWRNPAVSSRCCRCSGLLPAAAADVRALLMTSSHSEGLGFPMPQAGMQHGIEESVWVDPHIGGDHGFAEWARVVVDENVLLATADGAGTPMEAWRPLMEGCTSDDWEWTVHSKAWADEWLENKQFPFLAMDPAEAAAMDPVANVPLWSRPHRSPWPSWHGPSINVYLFGLVWFGGFSPAENLRER